MEKKIKLPEIDLSALLKAGCHFGHRVSKTHPKIRPYLYTSRDGIQIFDLIKTGQLLDQARHFLASLAARGEKIIFVGTKRQAKKVIRQVAKEAQMPYINIRWLGGLLTNWNQMQKRIKRLQTLQEQWEKGEFKQRTKKEQSLIRKEIAGLTKKFGGLVGLKDLPAALFVVDIAREKAAVMEGRRLGIPVVAIVDSNADPTLVDYPIPANDDARKSVELLVKIIGEAITAGRQLAVNRQKEEKSGKEKTD